MTDYVAYYRVSTQKQGEHGLGMDAQRSAVNRFLRDGDAVLHSFTEVESGAKSNRPQLIEALAMCKQKKATLLIAKLDRLARNVHFISGLMEGGVKFIACDMPDAEPFRLHIEAAFAEEERRRISKRIKEALAEAKKRGVKLGGFRGEASIQGLRRSHADKETHRKAFASTLEPVVKSLMPITARRLAAELNARGIKTQGNGVWYTQSAKRLIKRLGA